MKKPHDLFLLIKGMSKAEKGYFKKYTSLHIKGSKNNYIRLFDLLSKMEAYNEEELKKKLRNNPLIGYLSSAKIYLYNLILKSLRAYYSDSSHDVKIFENLLNADILKKKSLLEQSNKALQNAYELAECIENFPLLLRIHDQRMQNIVLQADLKTLDDYWDTVNAQKIQLLEKIKEIMDIDIIHFSEMKKLWTRGYTPFENHDDTSLSAEPALSMSHPLLKEEKKFLSKNALLKSLEAKRVVLINTGNHDQLIELHMQIFQLLDEDVALKRQHWLSYASRMCNYIFHIFITGRIDEAEATFQKINTHEFESLHEQLYICSYAFANILHAYIHSGRVDNVSKIYPNIVRMLDKHKDRMPLDPMMAIYYNMGTTSFIQRDYSQAIRWNNNVINSERKKTRQDIHEIAQVMNIIFHYEQKNHDLVESLIESFQRKLAKHKAHFPFTHIALKQLKKLCFCQHPEELEERCIAFRDELQKYTIKACQDEYILIAWINSKIQKRTIQELLEESYLQLHANYV